MYSNHPAGTLANANLRGLRKRVREVFDPIWRSGPISEKNAKQQLAEILQIEVQDCDINVFDELTCERVLHLLRPEEEE